MGKTSGKLWKALARLLREAARCEAGVLGRKDDWAMVRLGYNKLTRRRSSVECLCKLVLIQNSIKKLVV